MLLAPWILYMVTMATQRVSDNRLSLVTSPMGCCSLWLTYRTDIKLEVLSQTLSCREVKRRVLANIGKSFVTDYKGWTQELFSSLMSLSYYCQDYLQLIVSKL